MIEISQVEWDKIKKADWRLRDVIGHRFVHPAMPNKEDADVVFFCEVKSDSVEVISAKVT